MDFEEETLEKEEVRSGKDEPKVGNFDQLQKQIGDLKTYEAEVEIKDKEHLDKIRQDLGLEKSEDQKIPIEIKTLLDKLSIPFNDEGTDKRRQELLKDTEKKIKADQTALQEYKVKKEAEIEKTRVLFENYHKEIEELEKVKAEKEKEIDALRKESEDYIEKTKPPIIRRSTKEKLAIAKGIVQYFKAKKINEDKPSYVGNYDNSYTGFTEVSDKIDEIKKITQQISTKQAPEAKSSELTRIEDYIENKKTHILDTIKQSNGSLESLKSDQEEIDRKKEEIAKRTEFIKKTLLDLLPKDEESPIETNPSILKIRGEYKRRSEKNIAEDLDNFLSDKDLLEKLGIKSQEEAILKLKEEIKNVHDSVFITFNLNSDSLMRILSDGKIKSTEEIKPEERKGNRTEESYQSVRIEAEQELGINATEENPYPIYGALACKNGHDEIEGAAEKYGDIFIKLKPEVMTRCGFVNGDSAGHNEMRATYNYDNNHTGVLEEARNDYERTRNRGLDNGAAILDKAIINIKKGFINYIPWDNYIEAQILGGVKVDDIETINIKVPEDEYTNKYQSTKKTIEDIKQKFPQYAGLIKEV